MPLLPFILVLLSTFMHAAWNLAAHAQRTSRTLFLRIPLLIGLVGLGPVILSEWRGPSLPTQIWGWLALAGLFQASYYLGLTMGYRGGDFTVVYPVARAVPVLVLAGFDLLRGRPPSPMGWLGLVLVAAGCLLIPLESLRRFTLARYWNRTMAWILLIALSTVGYTIVDKLAAERLPSGPQMAARYGILEFLFSVPYLWVMLALLGEPTREEMDLAHWKWPAIAAVLMLGAYWLVLWSYQLSPFVSYVVALRQFSIVVGVALGILVLREPAPALRLGAALVIGLGIACIALAG